MDNLYDMLESRGFIYEATKPEELRKLLMSERVTVYIGFDPTAPSLHLGNLLPIMGLVHSQRCGHRPIAVMGGGTGMVGDPSGKTEERSLMSEEEIEHNLEQLKRQFEKFLDFGKEGGALMLNNADWLREWRYLDFLRDIGKHFNIAYMINKESVKRRIEDQERSLSYTEFSYMLLQAYDFLFLRKNYDCKIQMGGSDQWGNITAGIDLIRKVLGKDAYGITFPLLTTSSGAKFGKSEQGTPVWLDPSRTSPYQMYQHLIRTDDRDVVRYLRLLTLIDLKEIEELEDVHRKEPEKREAHRALAFSVTEMVHGKEAAMAAQRASEILYGEPIENADDAALREIFKDVPCAEIDREILAKGFPLVDALVNSGLAKSRSDARRLIKSGGVYVNNRRSDPDDVDRKLTTKDMASQHFLVLRKGKKDYHLFLVR